MGDSSPQNCPTWVLPMGCSPSGTGCSKVGPLQSHKSCQETCSSMGSSLSIGPQVLPEACSSVGSPQGHSLFWASTCSGVVSSTDCRWISAPPWTSMGCRGTSALTPETPPPLPSSLTLVSTELFLSHILTPLSGYKCCSAVTFPPLRKYVITEALPPPLTGPALASSGSLLEPAGTGSVGHGGNFQQLPTEATANLVQIANYLW